MQVLPGGMCSRCASLARRCSARVSRLYGIFCFFPSCHASVVLIENTPPETSCYHTGKVFLGRRRSHDDGETEAGEAARCKAQGGERRDCLLGCHVCAATHRRCPDPSMPCMWPLNMVTMRIGNVFDQAAGRLPQSVRTSASQTFRPNVRRSSSWVIWKDLM